MTTDPQNDLQQMLGDMLRDDASFEDFLDSQQTSFIELQTVLNILYLIVGLTLLVGYGTKVYRLWLPAYARTENQYRASYRAALDKLSAIGVHRRPGESREAFARRASTVSPTLTEMTALHLQSALGATKAANDASAQWRRLQQRVDTEIHASTQFGKRLLALINPFSWMLTR
jgi:hypothetical protein